jgi:hypothetical protein
MRLYELAYFINEKCIFIPGILSKDMPDNLPKFHDEECLTMSFDVKKALPPNIVCRIIVQRNNEILNEDFLWRKGAVLKPETINATALIKEEERRIVVDVKGNDRTEYLSELREILKNIFEDYKGINPDLRYKILVSEELKKRLPDNVDLMRSEKDIIADLKLGRDAVEPHTLTTINLSITNYNYNILNNNSVVNIDNRKQEFHYGVIQLGKELHSLANELRNMGKDNEANIIDEHVETMDEIQETIETSGEEEFEIALMKRKSLLKSFNAFYIWAKDKADEVAELIPENPKDTIIKSVDNVSRIQTIYTIASTLLKIWQNFR